MTEPGKTEVTDKNTKLRSWLEINGPTVYGVGVFVALAILMAIHLIVSG